MKSDSFSVSLPPAPRASAGLTQTEHAIGRIWQRMFGLNIVSPADGQVPCLL